MIRSCMCQVAHTAAVLSSKPENYIRMEYDSRNLVEVVNNFWHSLTAYCVSICPMIRKWNAIITKLAISWFVVFRCCWLFSTVAVVSSMSFGGNQFIEIAQNATITIDRLGIRNNIYSLVPLKCLLWLRQIFRKKTLLTTSSAFRSVKHSTAICMIVHFRTIQTEFLIPCDQKEHPKHM